MEMFILSGACLVIGMALGYAAGVLYSTSKTDDLVSKLAEQTLMNMTKKGN